MGHSPTLFKRCTLDMLPFFYFAHRPSSAQMRRSPDDLSYTALEAMSALVCSGPVFDPRGLGPDGYMYKWLDSMMRSHETCVQTLARRTIQQLLQNNSQEPLLLNWVVDHCYDNDRTTAQLYFHALSNTFFSMYVSSVVITVRATYA